MAEQPLVNPELCNGCGVCVSVCACGALVMVDNVIMLKETEACGYCTYCEAVCPTGAIRCPFEIVFAEE